MRLIKKFLIVKWIFALIMLNLLMVQNVEAEKEMAGSEFSSGLVEFKAGNFRKALEHFQAAKAADPNKAETYYYIGLAYFKMEQFRRVAPFFEKSIELDPKWSLEAHYYTGMAYYQRDLFDEAEKEFQDAIKADPNSQIAQSSKEYLGKIPEQRITKEKEREALRKVEQFEEEKPAAKKLEFVLGLGYFYDTNVILQPKELQVPPTNQKDFSPTLMFSATYKPISTEKWELSGTYRFDQILYQKLDDFNSQTHAGSLDTIYKISDTKQALFDYYYTYYLLDNRTTLIQHTFSPGFRWALTGYLVTELRYDLSLKNFYVPVVAPEENQDSANNRVSLSQFLFFSNNTRYFRGLYSYGDESTRGDNWDYKSNLVGLSFSTPLFFLSEVIMGFIYEDRDYKHEDTLRQQGRRSDLVRIFSIDLKKTFWKSFLTTLSYEHTRNGSTFRDFDYERDLVGIKLQYTF